MNKQKIIIFIIFLAIIASGCFLIFTLKETDNYVIKSQTFGDLSYIGNVIKDTPNGKATIKNDDNSFYLKGEFDNGKFKEGTIILNKDNEEFYLEGTFDNLLLQEGKIIITTQTERIEKLGTFIDNKLNGIGSLKITDIQTGELKFVYAGKFTNDTPIYN